MLSSNLPPTPTPPPKVEAALAASIFHRHTVEISEVKAHCARAGFAIRATPGAATRSTYRWVRHCAGPLGAKRAYIFSRQTSVDFRFAPRGWRETTRV